MGRTPNALEQSPHDSTCGSGRAGNDVDYREIILGNGTSTCQPLDTKTCVSKAARIEPQAKSGEEIPDPTAFHPGYTRDKTGTHISIDKRPLTHSSAMSITARSFSATAPPPAGGCNRTQARTAGSGGTCRYSAGTLRGTRYPARADAEE